MSRMTFKQWTKRLLHHRPNMRNARKLGQTKRFERLEGRVTPAVNAFFSAGHLLIFGDAADNAIEVSQDAGGAIQVNGGVVPVRGGSPTVGNTLRLQIFGLSGNDSLRLNEANGTLPRASIFGGSGNDTLVGGSAADFLFGQSGSDTLFGQNGADSLFGGGGDDLLTGGAGDDRVFGQAGVDRLIWNPGDASDLNEGGGGSDTIEVIGGNAAEEFTATANGARIRLDRLTPSPFFIDIGTAERLVVNANGGDDRFSATGNLAALIQIDVDGGSGNDTLLGGNGDDVLLGGDGDDFIDGNGGADFALLGNGRDTFRWDPGDGSDIVDGEAGADTMLFNGSDLAERFDVSANGNRMRFSRDVGSITMDLDGVEQIDVNAFGGADAVNVNEQSATDLTVVNVNFAASLAAAAGDGANDSVIVNGTSGDDFFQIASIEDGSRVVIASTLFPFVHISGAETANDRLVVNTLDGHDGVDAGSLAADAIGLTLNGGAGNDELLAGGGNDLVNGGAGNDLVFLEAGNDTFVWNPGDGSDTVEGMAGRDTMVFNGNGFDENITIFANGDRVRVTRNIGAIVMDINEVERVNVNALGGADSIVVNDLGGTDLTEVNLDANAAGGGDSQADIVVVNGTNGSERIVVADSVSGGERIGGLAAVVRITAPDADLDQLTINALGGDDTVDASSLGAGLNNFTINGGDGDDVLIGGDGSATLSGGAGDDDLTGGVGDDVLIGGPGQDIFDGGPGNNILIQD